jgi:hypothetical protein
MATIQNTLLLDQTAWDLVLDINGNIALAGTPYSYAQDTASAVRTFAGECWYNTNLGVPYWQQVLGELPPLGYIEQQISTQALTVPNVISAEATIVDFKNREVKGVILITDVDSNPAIVAFGGQ